MKAEDEATILASCAFPWTVERAYPVRLSVAGQSITARVGEQRLLTVQDPVGTLAGGGIALLCEEGSLSTEAVAIRPLGANARAGVPDRADE